MNLEEDPRNPIFKVLHVKEYRDEILKVSLCSLKISMSWSLLPFNLSVSTVPYY